MKPPPWWLGVFILVWIGLWVVVTAWVGALVWPLVCR